MKTDIIVIYWKGAEKQYQNMYDIRRESII